jgi:hypothetical protein
MVHGDSPQSHRVGPTDHAADLFHDAQVDFAAAEFFLDLQQFGPVQPFALAFSGNDAVFHRPFVHFGHDFFAVVLLVSQAQLLLVLTAANSGNDGYNQRMPIPRVQTLTRTSCHFDTSLQRGVYNGTI